jgi:hypothetical protein
MLSLWNEPRDHESYVWATLSTWCQWLNYTSSKVKKSEIGYWQIKNYSSNYKIKQRGVSHCGIAIYMNKYLKAKEEF